MEFKALSLEDCLNVRKWRNETLNALRTPFGLTEEQQREFYSNTVCDRKSNARYWGIWVIAPSNVGDCGILVQVDTLIGMAGIENIEWENRRGEISLILDPEQRSMRRGDEAFSVLLKKGFDELNLENIWGVCYECNPAIKFWERQINKYGASTVLFPNMKFYQGKYWSGMYFNFERSRYESDNT